MAMEAWNQRPVPQAANGDLMRVVEEAANLLAHYPQIETASERRLHADTLKGRTINALYHALKALSISTPAQAAELSQSPKPEGE
jgi:hypothetical protein